MGYTRIIEFLGGISSAGPLRKKSQADISSRKQSPHLCHRTKWHPVKEINRMRTLVMALVVVGLNSWGLVAKAQTKQAGAAEIGLGHHGNRQNHRLTEIVIPLSSCYEIDDFDAKQFVTRSLGQVTGEVWYSLPYVIQSEKLFLVIDDQNRRPFEKQITTREVKTEVYMRCYHRPLGNMPQCIPCETVECAKQDIEAMANAFIRAKRGIHACEKR